jgi:hypothetical protein
MGKRRRHPLCQHPRDRRLVEGRRGGYAQDRGADGDGGRSPRPRSRSCRTRAKA